MIKRIVEAFRDRAVRRVAKFGLPVTLGKAMTSIASLVQLSLLAHHLGLVEFGVLALIRVVVSIVDQYSNFNTWQAVVKYGTEAMARACTRDVCKIIKLAVWIDFITAVIATLVVVGLALIVPHAFSWNAHEALLCALYAVTLITRLPGASDGIFRICDAYRAQAIVSAIGAFAMTVSIGVAVWFDASFDGCVCALVIGEVISNLLITLCGFWVAKRSSYGAWWSVELSGYRTTFPGILRFLLATSGQLTVKKTQTELDMVVVGSMLGTAASGLFRVVKQFGTIPGRVFMPFEQVLFTELARHAAERDYLGFRQLLRRAVGLAILGSLGVWIVTAVLAGPIIRLVAGSDFLPAVWPLRWYLLAMVLVIANAPTQRALVALGRPGVLFFMDLVTLGVLVAMIVSGAMLYGLVGVTVAVLLHKVLQLSWTSWLVERTLAERMR